MNNRRNKANMEKIFASVISLAVMVALLFGISSILSDDGGTGKNGQKNYINLNEMAEGETTSQTEKETAKNVAGIGDTRNSGREAQINIDDAEEDLPEGLSNDKKTADNKDALNDKKIDDGKTTDKTQSVEKASEKNTEAVENVAKAESADEAVNEIATEGMAGSEVAVADTVSETVNESVPEDGQAAELAMMESTEDVSEQDIAVAAPINSGTADILGYSFGEGSSLMWPVNGNIILTYNMDNTIYFPTLDVYKCNPAIVISAAEGSLVTAAADGIVTALYETAETGLTMDVSIGNDYVMTYGQLKDMAVGVGSQVSRGDVVASVAAPSPYYSIEGSNLYFMVKKGSETVNPLDYISNEPSQPVIE